MRNILVKSSHCGFGIIHNCISVTDKVTHNMVKKNNSHQNFHKEKIEVSIFDKEKNQHKTYKTIEAASILMQLQNFFGPNLELLLTHQGRVKDNCYFSCFYTHMYCNFVSTIVLFCDF